MGTKNKNKKQKKPVNMQVRLPVIRLLPSEMCSDVKEDDVESW